MIVESRSVTVRPCEVCGAMTALPRWACACGGRHAACLRCVIRLGIVPPGLVAEATLTACPAEEAVAQELMREEGP